MEKKKHMKKRLFLTTFISIINLTIASDSNTKNMYWGSEEDEKQKKSNFQVTRKELKRRGRKKLNPSDVDTQRF